MHTKGAQVGQAPIEETLIAVCRSTAFIGTVQATNGDRIFRLDYRKNPSYLSNMGGTAENIYYNYSTGGISYNHDMIKDEMLIPNGVSKNASINYELTGYINDVNTQYTQVLMEYGANQSITNVYEYGDQRNSATINGTKAYYMYDGRGSVSSMTGNSGRNVVSYNYDAYGVVTKCSSTLNNPYQYNAEYTDSSTEYQYLRARYYDPEHGRFLTKDTYLGEPNDPLSRNLYTYVRNNPVNLIDPSGHLFGLILGIVTVGMALYGTYKAVDNHNQQTAAIRNQQASYERGARVQENVQTKPNNLKAPTSPNQKGNFSYYNARDKKVVTFTSAAAYFEYKKLCDELDKLDKQLALSVVHNTLDAIGVIPGVGEVADALNGAIYFCEGDYGNALLSVASCIPVVGDAAGKGGRAANQALGYTDEAADFLGDAAKYGDDVADFAEDFAKHGDDFKRVVDPPKPSINDSIARANKQVSSNDTKAWLAKGESNSTVYRGVEDNGYTYVGKTRQDLNKRKAQHNSSSNSNQKHFDDLENIFQNGEKPLTNNQARAVEQAMIEGGDYLNKRNIINSISPNNPHYEDAVSWGRAFLKDQQIKFQ